jgi:hypothetical protein
VTSRARIHDDPTEDTLRRLLEDARAAGAEELVVETTHDAGDGWIRAGFTELARVLTSRVTAVEAHLGKGKAESFGSLHVQTDSVDEIASAVNTYVPRLPGGSRGSVVVPPRDGWVSVYDELCDREPEMLRRLGREISNRTGALVLTMGLEEGRVVRYIALERGRVVDEYLSVPEFYGPLPPGEVISLGANPRLMGRLTGADPERIREVARTGADPVELPPARELIAALAETFGVDADHGYPEAGAIAGATVLARDPFTTP